MSWEEILKDKEDYDWDEDDLEEIAEQGEVVDITTNKGKVFVTIRFDDGYDKIFVGDASNAGLPRDVE